MPTVLITTERKEDTSLPDTAVSESTDATLVDVVMLVASTTTES